MGERLEMRERLSRICLRAVRMCEQEAGDTDLTHFSGDRLAAETLQIRVPIYLFAFSEPSSSICETG